MSTRFGLFYASKLWNRRKKWNRQPEIKPRTRVFAFHIALIDLRKVCIQLFSIQLWVKSIITTLSYHQHRYPWPSLATPPYRSSLPAGLQGYNSYLQRAAVYRFELVALSLLGHVNRSTGVHPLWARLYFPSRVLHVWFV